jgi:hypothetical protein
VDSKITQMRKTTSSVQAPPNASNLLLLSIYDTRLASHASTSITTFVLKQLRNMLGVPVMPSLSETVKFK